ncbi:DNA polymerase III subunit psi [Budvicia aquatica]|uniref:DNA polymerase III subunit psi n=1 Tax=Budvicia aquatica TaxID=82979 RepID=A0A484ZHA0_9GAMM|nr:DNA polymerase III subunit psi [Budvicia aquatica]
MTTSRLDWQLEQMGIRQYQLRRPAALHGEVAIVLPDNVRVILLADKAPSFTSPLLQDILRAISLSPEQIYWPDSRTGHDDTGRYPMCILVYGAQ